MDLCYFFTHYCHRREVGSEVVETVPREQLGSPAPAESTPVEQQQRLFIRLLLKKRPLLPMSWRLRDGADLLLRVRHSLDILRRLRLGHLSDRLALLR